jgi:hypothetical protein
MSGKGIHTAGCSSKAQRPLDQRGNGLVFANNAEDGMRLKKGRWRSLRALVLDVEEPVSGPRSTQKSSNKKETIHECSGKKSFGQ